MAFKDRLYEWPVVGTALRVQDRYKVDAGDQFAGSIGFFGFLSLFPMIMLALSVAGFVLASDPQQVADLAVRIEGAIPGLEALMGEDGVGDALQGVIDNRGTVGVIGAALLLFSALRVVNSAQTATQVVFRVDRMSISPVRQRGQQLVALVALGLLALLGTAAGGMVGWVTQLDLLGISEVVAPALTFVVGFVLDVTLFLAAYRLFATSDGPGWRVLLPGAVLAGTGWALLKLLGSTYVASQVDSSRNVYGALAGVIGMMLLLYLAGRLYVYGAELSAVRAPDPGSPADPPTEVESDTRPDAADDAAAAAAAGAPPIADGAPLFPSGAPSGGPAERPSTSEMATVAPTASAATRARLAAMPEPPRGGQGRRALAFTVAVGAVAGLVGALRPWEKE
jgi:membrane protein